VNHSTKVLLVIFFLLFLPRLNKETVENKSLKSEALTERTTLPSNTDSHASTTQKSQLKTSTPPIVYCTGNYSDSGEDLDGTSLFDHIIFFVEINVTQEIFSFSIILHIQPLVQGESPNSIKSFEVLKQEKRNLGIHNVSIPFVNAEYFYSVGHDLSFHFEKIDIHYFIQSHVPLFTVYDPYTTRVYSREEFDPPIVLITGRIWDKVEDSDFNWYYDNLLIRIEVWIGKAGKYQVEIELEPEIDTFREVLKGVNQSFLEFGMNVISIPLDAALLRKQRINGSLVVTQIKVINKNNVIVTQLYPDYVTQVYSYTDFDVHLIAINGNEEFNLFADDMELQGDGSPLNPYIIEGFVFTSAASWNLISVENVDVSFQITNNILHGGVIAIKLCNITNAQIVDNSLQNNQIGIYLNNVDECIIQHNTISGHNEGLYLVEADKNLIESNSIDYNLRGIKLTNNSNNNVIIDNSISNSVGTDNFGRGILIANNSDNNLVKRNDFLNNNNDVIDSGLSTTFLSNYWANWTMDRDLTPSELPNHLTKPIILSPLKGETIIDPVLVIKWIANDTLGHELTYDIYYSSDNETIWTLLSTGGTESPFDWNIRNVTQGYYQIKIVSCDSLGFISWEISDIFAIQTPLNPTPVVGSLFGTILLIIVCISLLFKFK
jgi:parallel beta-helix repeat protein